MGLTRQLLAVLRELVSAPGTGESIKAAVISDRCAVDNELLGARLGSKDGGECATGRGSRRITYGQCGRRDVDSARREQDGGGVVVGEIAVRSTEC